MVTISVSTLEADARLPDLLGLVAGGEEVAITDNGRVVARLVPPLPEEDADDGGRPWRGVFAPPRPRKDALALPPVPALDTLPRRPVRVNMNWHRTDADGE